MINNPNDIGFIQDIAGLDKLRQKAVNGDENAGQSALTAAARQFESIFTSMMLKSMRDANSDFKSDLMSSQNEDLYRQMLDEQMASEFSSSGSLGLADMIVAQLSTGQTASEQKGRMASKKPCAVWNMHVKRPVSVAMKTWWRRCIRCVKHKRFNRRSLTLAIRLLLSSNLMRIKRHACSGSILPC